MAGTTLGAISPCSIVTDVNQALAFYCDKLGFQKRFQEPDTDPFFAIVGRDTAQPHTSSLHALDAFVYVEDPDTLAAEFSDRGVDFSAPLKDTHDGLRGFEIHDPDGYVLFFGRPR